MKTHILNYNAAKFLGLVSAVALLGVSAVHANGVSRQCRAVSLKAYIAEFNSISSERDFALAKAYYLPFGERREAIQQAQEDWREARREIIEVYWARIEVCQGTGERIYNPIIDPENFLSAEEAAANPNPYRPLVPGTTFVYESDTEDGLETIRVEVTRDTKEILGVECIVVHDVVTMEGETIEDTFDWFAQDKEGNVWYFGEISFNYEDGEISDLDGSWKAGTDGAKPGIIAFTDPVVDTVFRQEFLLGEAEDIGEIISLDETASTPYGNFDGCLMTADYTPLEPDVIEFKFYKPGVGFVKEVKPAEEEDEVVELVAIEVE